jgi:hypothetical protein
MRNKIKGRKGNLTGMFEGYEGSGRGGGGRGGSVLPVAMNYKHWNKYKEGNTFLSLELPPSRRSDNIAIIASSLFSLLIFLLSA